MLGLDNWNFNQKLALSIAALLSSELILLTLSAPAALILDMIKVP